MTKISPARRRNLEKLAAYLEYLPEDYKHFDMEAYVMSADEEDVCRLEMEYAKKPELVFECGTVACALGHGPAAGIRVMPRFIGSYSGIDWDSYGDAHFIETGSEFTFLFGGFWVDIDNHHWGAAARIRYLLDGGDILLDGDTLSGNWNRKLYANYRVTARGPLPEGALPLRNTAL